MGLVIWQCILGRGRQFYGQPFLNVYVADLDSVLRERERKRDKERERKRKREKERERER